MQNLAYSIHEAEELSGLCRTKLYELLKSGCLPARKLGRRTLILRADLEAFLTELPKYHADTGAGAR